MAIYFLGSPMSPYYRLAASGAAPDPRDWCGVFFTLHEQVAGRWHERAYAYNLYRNGCFSRTEPLVQIGGSEMAFHCDEALGCWMLNLCEPGLWRRRIEARLAFRAAPVPSRAAAGDDTARHAWALVAPLGRMEGRVEIGNASVSFAGSGYHDHNFGHLPYTDTQAWYWGRSTVIGDDGRVRSVVLYHLVPPIGAPLSALTVSDEGGRLEVATDEIVCALAAERRSPYGLRHATHLEMKAADGVRVTMRLVTDARALSEGPFYRRLPTEMRYESTTGQGSGQGIGEFFRPAKLCGPIASRAMWSRIRRRA